MLYEDIYHAMLIVDYNNIWKKEEEKYTLTVLDFFVKNIRVFVLFI